MPMTKRFACALKLTIDHDATSHPERWVFHDLLDLHPDESVNASIYPVCAAMDTQVRFTDAGMVELDMTQHDGALTNKDPRTSFVILLDLTVNSEETAEPGKWDFANLLDLHGQYSLQVSTFEVEPEKELILRLIGLKAGDGIEAYISTTYRALSKDSQPRSAQALRDFMPREHLEALRLLGEVIGIVQARAAQAPGEAARMAEAIQPIPGVLAGDNANYHLPALISRARALVAAHSSAASSGGN